MKCKIKYKFFDVNNVILFFFIIFMSYLFNLFIVYAKEIKYVSSTSEFRRSLEELSDNDCVIVLKTGVYVGNFFVYKPVELLANGFVLLTSNNTGSILNIYARDVKIKGIKFYNSGKNMSVINSCVFVSDYADNVAVIDSFFSECGFGAWVNGSSYNYFFKNVFVGAVENILSDRGNSIHLFKNNNTVVTNNFIINGRDGVYISNSKEVFISKNIFINVRFGIHYMFSHKCNVVSNMICGSLIGIAIMYSKYVELINNFMCFNTDHGLFFRDVLYSRIFKNKSLYNFDGVFFGSSYYNDMIYNDVIKNNIGIKVSNGSNENLIYNNNFISNRLQVLFLDIKTVVWNSRAIGNFWSHYIGWDLNMDNIGDKKFYVTNVSDKLVFVYPVLRIMFNSPAFILLQKIENHFPAFRKFSVIDYYPLMSPVLW